MLCKGIFLFYLHFVWETTIHFAMWGEITMHNTLNTQYSAWNMVVAAACWEDALCEQTHKAVELIGRRMKLHKTLFWIKNKLTLWQKIILYDKE